MGRSNVSEMNPLAAAEDELAAYFEGAAAELGMRAQCVDKDRFGGVFDELASARLHLSRLRKSHHEAVQRARAVEMTLAAIHVDHRRTIFLGFERRGYAYHTPLGALRLWEAFRRSASNVGLLGLVLEVPTVADRLVRERTRQRGKEAPLHHKPTIAELVGFLEETAVAAYDRWDAKRPPGHTEDDDMKNAGAWLHWLPRWVTQANHAADRRLIGALRAYEDVRAARVEQWERPRARAERQREIQRLDVEFARILAGKRRVRRVHHA